MSVALLKGRMGKIMAVLLSAVLVLSLLPTTAFAADTVVYTDGQVLSGTITGSSDVNDPKIISITGEVTVSGTVAVSGCVKITGGGTIKNVDSDEMIRISSYGDLVLEDITIDAGETGVMDNTIYVGAQAKLTINDGTVITGCYTDPSKVDITINGAAIKAMGGHVVMNGGSIEGNAARNYGNIHLDASATFVMNGGTVKNNRLSIPSGTYGGGGFYIRTATLTINGGTISNNTTNAYGGGIYCTSYGKLIINGGTIEGNTSTTKGDGIYFSSRSANAVAELYIGGDANVVDEIYLDSEHLEKYTFVTSVVKNPLKFTVERFEEGRTIAVGAASGSENEYMLTQSDLAKMSVAVEDVDTQYYAKLDSAENAIFMTATNPEYVQNYYISYYANGGTGTTYNDTAYAAGETGTVAVSSFSREGHTFAGWNTKADGTGTDYAPGASIIVNSDINLYAKWQASPTYTVSALAETGGTASGGGTFNEGDSTTITATPNTNYLFAGWYEGRTFVSDSATLQVNNITSDKTYTAKFESLEYSVTLITGQGVINSGNVTSYIYGTGATLPTDLSYGSLTFDGWYADNEYATSPVTAISATDRGNKTYYAKWRANGVDASSFASTADSGFYSEAPNSPDNEKTGMIVFATQFADILSYGNQVTDFGIYLYKTGTPDENRIQLSKTDSESLGRLKANGGKFHAIAEAIPFAYFDAEVFALPYVVIGGQSYFGELLTDTVNKAKWLGALVGGNN